MRIENSLENSKQLWEKFSPKRILWDEWYINQCFYNPRFHELKFMYTEKSLLPLVYNSKDKRHEFFGNGFIENRTFWIDDSELDYFMDKIPENTYLFDMNGRAIEKIFQSHSMSGFKQDDYRNFWSKSTDEFFNSFSGASRNSLLRGLKKLDHIQFSIEDGTPELFNIFLGF